MTPLASFGGGDGWLAPGEGGYAFLGTGNNERSISYGASTNHLYRSAVVAVSMSAFSIR
jgi:hypothetical protein